MKLQWKLMKRSHRHSKKLINIDDLMESSSSTDEMPTVINIDMNKVKEIQGRSCREYNKDNYTNQSNIKSRVS